LSYGTTTPRRVTAGESCGDADAPDDDDEEEDDDDCAA
jgi:hypothetical protein